MRILRPLAAVTLLASGIPAAIAQTAPATQAANPARKALGVELAQLLNSEQLTRLQVRKLIDETFPKAMAADPQLKAMEDSYPGITRALLDAIEPVALESTIKTLPQLWDRLGTFYAENLTETDLKTTLDFFHKPVGAKLVMTMATGVDFSATAQQLVASPDAKITGAGLNGALTAGAQKLGEALTPAEQAEVVRFGATPAGQKLRGLKARGLEIAAAWSNENDSGSDAAIEKVATEAVEAFIAKQEQKKQ